MITDVLTRWLRPERWLDRDATYSLRGLCMLVIAMGHVSTSATDGLMQTEAWHRFYDLTNFGQWGTWCVGIFLFLSGYGMMLSLMRQQRTTWKYAARHLWKLFEAYLLVWVIYVVVFLLMDREQLTLRLLTDFVTLSLPLGVDAWFFKVIVAVYLVLFSLFALPMTNRWRVVTMAVLAVAYYCVMRQAGFGPWWFNTIVCVPLGMWMALRRNWQRERPWWLLIATAVMAVCSWLSTVAFLLPVTAVLVAVLLTWLCPVNMRLLHFIGVNSLYFYLLEEPAYNYLTRPLSYSLPLYVVATWVVCGVLTWAWIWCKKKVKSDE